jgi:flagellar hook-associated protein 2
MSTSPVYFTGVSNYSNDLQQVIGRAVKIASMPLDLIQTQRQDTTAQSSALAGLDTRFSALQDAIKKIENALGPTSYAATSSDPASVGASVTEGALEGSYTVTVNSPGSSASAISGASLAPVTDPYSSSFTTADVFTLTVGGVSVAIEPKDHSLMGLATAINQAASAGIQASVVNTGSSGSPNYRLVLRSASLGPNSIQLTEGAPGQTPPGADLLDPLSPGATASYTIGGIDQPIETTSRTVTLAPGVTIDLLRQTASPVTVTVSRGMDSISSAVSAFVDAYNAAVDERDKQVGTSAGALAGQSVVRSLSGSLRQITQYSATSGAVDSLTRMGVKLDGHGKLSFDASTLNSLSVQAVQGFLGSTSDGGFLKAANDAMNGVEDATSGSLKSAIDTAAKAATRQDKLIAAEQQRITDLQNSLTKQMAAADTLLASLQNQRDYFTNLFTAMMNQNVSNNSKSG